MSNRGDGLELALGMISVSPENVGRDGMRGIEPGRVVCGRRAGIGFAVFLIFWAACGPKPVVDMHN